MKKKKKREKLRARKSEKKMWLKTETDCARLQHTCTTDDGNDDDQGWTATVEMCKISRANASKLDRMSKQFNDCVLRPVIESKAPNFEWHSFAFFSWSSDWQITTKWYFFGFHFVAKPWVAKINIRSFSYVSAKQQTHTETRLLSSRSFQCYDIRRSSAKFQK